MKEKDKKIHIRLPGEVHKKLKVKCAYEDISVQEFVERIIRERLEDYSVGEALEGAGLGNEKEERAGRKAERKP